MVAQWLTEHGAEDGAEDPIKKLISVVLGRRIEVEHVALVYGIAVDESCELGHGFSIEPARHRDIEDRLIEVDLEWGSRWRAETLLVRRATERLLLEDPNSQERREATWQAVEDRANELEAALGIVSLSVKNGVFHGGRWAEVAGAFWHRPWGGAQFEGQMPARRRIPFTSQHLDRARRLLDAFYELKERDRDRVRAALSRYRHARTWRDPNQSAVDIAVAYETLLTGDQKGESISLALRLRAAWFLESDPESREEMYDLLGRLYNIRSDLVHTGGLKNRPWRVAKKNQSLIRESIERFEVLAERLILDGFPRSWTKVILGYNVQ